MKAIKSCYARYLWRHKFEIISEKTQLNWRGTGSHIGERKCLRCGLNQKISNTLGFLFLDEETGGKGTVAERAIAPKEKFKISEGPCR